MNTKIKTFSWFKLNLNNELQRIGKLHKRDNHLSILSPTVTCTNDNILNLYNSQFEDKTIYKEIYRYQIEG